MKTFLLIGTAILLSAIGIGNRANAQNKSPVRECRLLAGIPTGQTRVIDMSYVINSHSPAWPGDERPFTATTVDTIAKDGYFARRFTMLEHYETHMDAPAHFGGTDTLDELPIRRFFGPGVVLDVRDKVVKNPDYRLAVKDIEQWEAQHGRIPPHAIVMLYTGWGSRWPDQKSYRNMDAERVMHFPGYSVPAAKFLIARQVSGLGIDTLSIDYGPSVHFPVHHTTLPAGLFHLENGANLGALPATGAFIIAAPIKLQGGSGGPVRVFAILPR